MEIIYRIITLSILMAILYAGGSIYHYMKSKDEDKDMGRLVLGILINMLKIILVFSLVCTGMIFLFLKPVMKLLS